MKKVKLSEVVQKFADYNLENGIYYQGKESEEHPPLTAVAVYSSSNWPDQHYSLESRSYRIYSNSGKAFFSGMSGYSIYGDCLDGSESGIRLDQYRNWKIDYCYFEE